MGLVPKSARLPPHIGIAAGELPKASPTRPASAMGSAWKAATPKWLLLATEAKATPFASRAAIASRTASAQASKARPPPASTRQAPPRSRTTRGHRRTRGAPVLHVAAVLRDARGPVGGDAVELRGHECRRRGGGHGGRGARALERAAHEVLQGGGGEAFGHAGDGRAPVAQHLDHEDGREHPDADGVEAR